MENLTSVILGLVVLPFLIARAVNQTNRAVSMCSPFIMKVYFTIHLCEPFCYELRAFAYYL